MALTPLPEALAQLMTRVPAPPKTTRRSLEACLWQVLAEPVIAGLDVPPFDNAAMDGYALRAADIPGTVPVSQRIPAGSQAEPLVLGTAARIFTGAVMPEGADTVVMQEDALAQGDEVSILGCVTPGQHIRRRGADIRAGSEILSAGRRLSPQDLGLAASVGCADLLVFEPLRVAVITTGDELVAPGEPRDSWQIYNSNGPQIATQLAAMGITPFVLGALRDNPEVIGDALEQAAEQADCIVTCGGVSVGEEDHVRAQIEARGRLDLWKLAIKPGKPLAFGEVAGCPVFGLPGNPVSAWATFLLVVKPWLSCAQGAKLPPPRRMAAIADFEINKPGTREEYLRVTLSNDLTPTACLSRDQSSGVLSSVSRADALAVVPIGTTVNMGDTVQVIPVTELLSPMVG